MRPESKCLADVGTRKERMSFVPTATAVLNYWVRILAALEKKINRQSYDTWLKPTRFSHIAGETLFVRIPSAEFQHIGDATPTSSRRPSRTSASRSRTSSSRPPRRIPTPSAPAGPRGRRLRSRSQPQPERSHARPQRPRRRALQRRRRRRAVPLRLERRLPAQPKLSASTPSSSAAATSSPWPPRRPSPSAPPRPTTRSSSTAASAWARPT